MLLALVLLVAAGLIAWRVLAPAEVLDRATDAYPAAVPLGPGVTGKTAGAPLIVDGRIRVFAAKRQVRADAPVSAKTGYTPRWSYRRWPVQLNGVVAAGTTVVSRWSDGLLVAIDGRTGTITWRAAGPEAGGYIGHRTGAVTVWAPPGLHVAGTSLLVVGGGRVSAYDVASGAPRWEGTCGTDGFTTAGGQVVCGDVAYQATTGAAVRSWPVGPYTGVGCGVASSACVGLRDAAGRGWLVNGESPERAEALDTPGSTAVLVDRQTATGRVSSAFAITTGTVVAGRSPLTGGQLWRWPGRATVLGSGTDAVYLLTADRRLVTVDASTGAERSSFPLAVGTERTDWTPGGFQVADGYVAVERLTTGDSDPEAADHYFTVETVVIASTG
jgi:hypothetical protein